MCEHKFLKTFEAKGLSNFIVKFEFIKKEFTKDIVKFEFIKKEFFKDILQE